jgi:hypothetical protein
VENTNLKALRLSFVPATEALSRMEKAVNRLSEDAASSPDSAAIIKAAFQALVAALKIQALEGRHIAEARDEEMDRIEAEMKQLDSQIAHNLNPPSNSANAALQATFDEVHAAYADFQKVHLQILNLSRRNSNIRSFAMSLGAKRNVTGKCRDLLAALEESFQRDRVKATR